MTASKRSVCQVRLSVPGVTRRSGTDIVLIFACFGTRIPVLVTFGTGWLPLVVADRLKCAVPVPEYILRLYQNIL